ncbi:MAG: bacterial regulatory s, lacI family protein [Gammaproteobacteria bacterium]|nr:bacterial regulatory s, lacI family protein [Gammaproteobacteria bacterium]
MCERNPGAAAPRRCWNSWSSHRPEPPGILPDARGRMRGQRSSVVGLIIPDVQNDFYATVAKIVADNLAAHSMQLMLSVTEDDPDRELRELRALLEARPAW